LFDFSQFIAHTIVRSFTRKHKNEIFGRGNIMASFNKFFHDEVRRLARKEAKSATDKLVADVAALKKANVDMKRRLAELERSGKHFSKVAAKVQDSVAQPEEQDTDRTRFTGKTIRNMRAKLGLTQAEFGILAGVTGQSVYHWEASDERVGVRSATKANLVAMKKMGKKQALARLGELQ